MNIFVYVASNTSVAGAVLVAAHSQDEANKVIGKRRGGLNLDFHVLITPIKFSKVLKDVQATGKPRMLLDTVGECTDTE